MHSACTRETPRCEYWNRQVDDVRPPCCTAHLCELLSFTTDLLSRHGIFHWLDYGSLLGAVRAQDLIPWDYDGDFSCWEEDLSRILALQNEIRAAGFRLDAGTAPHALKIQYSDINTLHVDLWLCRVKNGRVCVTYQNQQDRWAFPVHYVRQLTTVTLCGKRFPAPSSLESFLIQYRYGPDYMTPQRQPAPYAWSRMPALYDEPNSPLLEMLLDEIRTNDFLISNAQAGHSAVAGHESRFSPYFQKFRSLISGRIARTARLAFAYPIVVYAWLTQGRRDAAWRATGLCRLSPTLALVVLERYRRRRLLSKLQKKAKQKPNKR